MNSSPPLNQSNRVGGGGGGQSAKDAAGNDVKSSVWLKTHQPGSRELTQGLKGDATYLIVTDKAEIEKYGLNAVCTHLGCVVPWNKAENKFMCPCHGSQYDATGKKVRGPARCRSRWRTRTSTRTWCSSARGPRRTSARAWSRGGSRLGGDGRERRERERGGRRGGDRLTFFLLLSFFPTLLFLSSSFFFERISQLLFTVFFTWS